jgi:hypothetical protein
LYELSKGPKAILNKFLIKQRDQDLSNNKKEPHFELNSKGNTCQNISDLQICNNRNQDQILIQIEKSQLLLCRFVQDKWEVSIKPQQ